jgi:hypothetical protein
MQNTEREARPPLDAKEAARVLKMDSRARRGYVPAHPLGEASAGSGDSSRASCWNGWKTTKTAVSESRRRVP